MLDAITCEYLASARPVDRAIVAEMLSSTQHRVTRCNSCEKYHIWIQVSQSEWIGAANARDRVTEDYYDKVGPNSYLHKGFKPMDKRKKKVKDGNEDED